MKVPDFRTHVVAAALLLVLAPSPVRSATFPGEVTEFTAPNRQPLFGEDAFLNVFKQYMVQLKVSEHVGKTVTVDFILDEAKFGGDLSAGIEAAFGIEVGVCVGGSADYNLAFQPSVSLPDSYPYGLAIPLSVSEGYLPSYQLAGEAEKSSGFTTEFPPFPQAYADLIFDLRAQLKANACVFGCFDAVDLDFWNCDPDINPRFPTRTSKPIYLFNPSTRCDPTLGDGFCAIEIASFNRDDAKKIRMLNFDADNAVDFWNEPYLEYDFNPANEVPIGPSGAYGSLNLDVPTVNSTSVGSLFNTPGTLRSSGTGDIMNLKIKVLDIIADLIPVKTMPPLSYDFNKGPIRGNYNLATLDVGPAIQLQTDFEMTWDLAVSQITFTEPGPSTTPRSVRLVWPANSPSYDPAGQLVNGLWRPNRQANEVVLLTNCDGNPGDTCFALPAVSLIDQQAVEIEITYELRPKLEALVSLPFIGQLDYAALQAGVTVDYVGGLGFGPLIEGAHKFKFGEFTVFDGDPKPIASRGEGKIQFTMQADGPARFQWRNDLARNAGLFTLGTDWIAPYAPGAPATGMRTSWALLPNNPLDPPPTITSTSYPGAPGSAGGNLARVDDPQVAGFGSDYWPLLGTDLSILTLKVGDVRPDPAPFNDEPEVWISTHADLDVTGGLVENLGAIQLYGNLRLDGEVGVLCGDGEIRLRDGGSVEAAAGGNFTLCNFNHIKGGGANGSTPSAVLNRYGELSNAPLVYYWDFDSAGNPPGLTLAGSVAPSPSGTGRSGQAGDRALDMAARSTARVPNPAALNAAAAGDRLTVSYWQKLDRVGFFHALKADLPGPASPPDTGLRLHSPWGDRVLYFDTGSDYADPRQRTQVTAPAAADFTQWHHFAFVKNGPLKQVWLDGNLVTETTNASPMPADFVDLWIGSETQGLYSTEGLLDDFAIFGGALSEDAIRLLAGLQFEGQTTPGPTFASRPDALGAGRSMLNNIGSIAAGPLLDRAQPLDGGPLQTRVNELVNQGTLRSAGAPSANEHFLDTYTYSIFADRLENRAGSLVEASLPSGGLDLACHQAKHAGCVSAVDGGQIAIHSQPTWPDTTWDAGQSFDEAVGLFRASGEGAVKGILGMPIIPSTIKLSDLTMNGGCFAASDRGLIEANDATFCGSMIQVGDVTHYFLSIRKVPRVEDLPSEDRSVVIVALVGGSLHVRAFDRDGNRVIDKAEGSLLPGPALAGLKQLLGGSPTPSTSDLSQQEQLDIILTASDLAESPLVNDLSGRLVLTEVLLDRVCLVNHGTVEVNGAVESVDSMLLANTGKLKVMPGAALLIRENVTLGGENRQPGIANATPESLLGGSWDIAGALVIQGAQCVRTSANAAPASTRSGAYDQTEVTTGADEAPGSRQLSLGKPADVTLRGPTWAFPALNTLEINGGRLALVDGANFSPLGAPGTGFTNAGEIVVDAGSNLNVDGLFLQRGPESRTRLNGGSLTSSTHEFTIVGGEIVATAGSTVLNTSAGAVGAGTQLRIEAPLREDPGAAIDPVTGYPQSRQQAVVIDIQTPITSLAAGAAVHINGIRAAVAGDEGIYFPALESLSTNQGTLVVEGDRSRLVFGSTLTQNDPDASIQVGAGAVIQAGSLVVNDGSLRIQVDSRPEQGSFGRLQIGSLAVGPGGKLVVDLFPDADPADVSASVDLGDVWKIITGPAGSGAAPVLTGAGFGLPGQFNDVVYRIRGVVVPSGQIPGTDYRLDLVPFSDPLRSEQGYAVKVVPDFGSAFMDYTTWATDVRMISPLSVLANPSQDATGNGYPNANEFFFQAVQHAGTTTPITPAIAASGQPLMLDPATDAEGNRYPRMSFVRPRGAPFGGSTGLENYRDARYLPFTSLDLHIWERAPLFVESVVAINKDFEERVTLQSQYAFNDPRRFFRVEGRFNPDNFEPGILPEKPISLEELATLSGLTNIASLPSVNYAIEPGQVVYFEVEGIVNNFDVIGGTAPDGLTRDFIYKSGSPLSGAAVHAGLLAEGEVGIVKVTLIPTQADFVGTYQRIKDGGFFEEARSRSGSSGGEPYSYRIELCACLD